MVGTKVSLSLEAPLQVPDNPMFHSFNVALDIGIDRRIPRAQTRPVGREAVHQDFEIYAYFVRCSLKVNLSIPHEHRDDVVATVIWSEVPV